MLSEEIIIKTMTEDKSDLELEWEEFKKNNINSIQHEYKTVEEEKLQYADPPESSELNISTKTRIVIMEREIDVFDLFWKLPIINYYLCEEGVVQKQCLFKCYEKEEYEKQMEMIDIHKANGEIIKQEITTHIDNTTGHIKFKNIKKIIIGVSHKDISKLKFQNKHMFYNCCVLIVRLFNKEINQYEEYHLKIFKTGKLEIPGSKNDKMFEILLEYIKKLLNQNYNSYTTILCNTNFSSNYTIIREKLYDLLINKYDIQAYFSPTSHHSIQCKMYFREEDGEYIYQRGDKHTRTNNSTKLGRDEIDNNVGLYVVSCMIFRTGSVLIITRMNMDALYKVYELLKKIFKDEYNNIKEKDNIMPQKKKNHKKILFQYNGLY